MRITSYVGLVLCLALGSVQAADIDKKAKTPAKAPASAQAKQEANNLFAQGFQAYQAGNMSIAQELFENGLKKFPNDATALYFLAEILRKQGEFGRAGLLFEQSLKLEPGGRYAIPAQGALKELQKEKQLAQNKQSARKLFAEGYDLLKAEKYAEARDKFAEGLKWDDDPKAKSLLQRAENGVRFHKGWEVDAPRLRALGVQDEVIKGTWNQLLNFDMPPLVPFRELTVKSANNDFEIRTQYRLEKQINGTYKLTTQRNTRFANQSIADTNDVSSTTIIDGGMFVVPQSTTVKILWHEYTLTGDCFSLKANGSCTRKLINTTKIGEKETRRESVSTSTNQSARRLQLGDSEYIAIKKISRTESSVDSEGLSVGYEILFLPQFSITLIPIDNNRLTIESFNGVPVNIDIKELLQGM